jgi:hypothetical protein
MPSGPFSATTREKMRQASQRRQAEGRGVPTPLSTVAQQARETIVSLYTSGGAIETIGRQFGMGPKLVKRVLAAQGVRLRTRREAREIVLARQHGAPTIKPQKQRAAASVAHREGGAASPASVALPPNRMEQSLIMRGMRPEVARLTARAWADRHAQIMPGRDQ